jgi:hypothetical protein
MMLLAREFSYNGKQFYAKGLKVERAQLAGQRKKS